MNQTYTVKSGDTLYGISNQFGVSATDLAKLNNITGSTIRVGQILKIPTNQGTNPDAMFMYTVKKGDSLYKIAQKYNTTVKAITDLNNLTNTNLSIGQQIRIPETYQTPTTQTPTYTNYTVQKGDSLYKIAQKFNTTVKAITDLNNLNNTNLSVGQTLRIPSTTTTPTPNNTIPSYLSYTVQKGDSLYSIAKKYNISVDQLKKDNGITSNTLSVGQNLKIRTNKDQSGEIEECIGEAYTPPTTDTIYTVVKGDSLYTIAKKFNTSVDNIKRKNNLTSNTLSIGQQLKI